MCWRRPALTVALSLVFMSSAGPALAAPYGMHAQLYTCCTDTATAEKLFKEAKLSGAEYIRVDINLPAIFYPERYADRPDLLDILLGPPPPQRRPPDWSGVDRIVQLSGRHQVPVLGILLGSPEPARRCPTRIDRQRLCPPADPRTWASQAGQVAARYRGAIGAYEIWNEPDGRWAFAGQPGDYARMLSHAYDEIKRRAPGTNVVLGGTMFPDAHGNRWLTRAFSTPGTNAAHKFDTGSIHVRGRASDMVVNLRRRRALFRRWGRSLPIWVTEHGYPSASRWQRDLFYRGGERAQAQYLSESLPSLALSGADKVFVTQRDRGGGVYGSEGLLRSGLERKPAWYAVAEAAGRWRPIRFRRRFISARGRLRKLTGRRRYRVVIKGKFRRTPCSGRLRLTFWRRRAAPLERAARLRRSCRYRRAVTLRVRPGTRRLHVSQRFLGNRQVGPGNARPMRIRIRRARR